MDAVVTGALVGSVSSSEGAAAASSGAPDSRTLLVDFSLPESLGVVALAQLQSYQVSGAAAMARRQEKERRYGPAVSANGSRQRLVPWVVETWGRHDSTVVELLKGAAQVAARRGAGRAACRDDAAEQRQDARVAASRGTRSCL